MTTFDVEAAQRIAVEGLHSDAVAQLSFALDEIDRLRSELDKLSAAQLDVAAHYKRERDDWETRAKRYEGALRFYASYERWHHEIPSSSTTQINIWPDKTTVDDMGARARNVLADSAALSPEREEKP